MRGDVGHHARTGRGEAAHRLEVGVDWAGDIAPLDQVGNTAKQRGGEPGYGDHDERLAGADVIRPTPAGSLDGGADGDAADQRDHERHDRLAVDQGDDDRKNQGQTEPPQDQPNQAATGPQIDSQPSVSRRRYGRRAHSACSSAATR